MHCVCLGYRIENHVQDSWPGDPQCIDNAVPQYETLKGWQAKTEGLKNAADIPEETHRYLNLISERLEIPLQMVSTGPDRGQEIWFKRPW